MTGFLSILRGILLLSDMQVSGLFGCLQSLSAAC